MVHRREVANEPVILGNHGALFGNAMTWWDHETGSVWSQPTGSAIAGPLKGTELELLPSTLTTWGDWRSVHTDSLALDAPSVVNGFDLDNMSVVVELGEDSVAFPVETLREVGVANGQVGDIPVAVVLQPDTDNWAVFSRRLDDRVVELTVIDGALRDTSSTDRWNLMRGFPLGHHLDEGLDLLPGFTSFPGDYKTFFPTGAEWQRDGPPVPVSG